MSEPETDMSLGEFIAGSVAALAAAVFGAAVILMPYPRAGVCLAVAAIALVVGLIAATCFALLRWKRGAL